MTTKIVNERTRVNINSANATNAGSGNVFLSSKCTKRDQKGCCFFGWLSFSVFVVCWFSLDVSRIYTYIYNVCIAFCVSMSNLTRSSRMYKKMPAGLTLNLTSIDIHNFEARTLCDSAQIECMCGGGWIEFSRKLPVALLRCYCFLFFVHRVRFNTGFSAACSAFVRLAPKCCWGAYSLGKYWICIAMEPVSDVTSVESYKYLSHEKQPCFLLCW